MHPLSWPHLLRDLESGRLCYQIVSRKITASALITERLVGMIPGKQGSGAPRVEFRNPKFTSIP